MAARASPCFVDGKARCGGGIWPYKGVGSIQNLENPGDSIPVSESRSDTVQGRKKGKRGGDDADQWARTGSGSEAWDQDVSGSGKERARCWLGRPWCGPRWEGGKGGVCWWAEVHGGAGRAVGVEWAFGPEIEREGVLSFYFLISNFFYILFFQNLFQESFEDK